MKLNKIIRLIHLFVLIGTTSMIAQNNTYKWAKSFGSASTTNIVETGQSVTVDAAGNVYTTGIFQGTVDFDPGSGETNLTAGAWDIFITKFDASGNFIWVKSMGGAGSEYVYSIAVDASGNVYTTGYIVYTVVGSDFDHDTDAGILISKGSGDPFICKLDTNGNFIWAKNFGGTNNDVAYCIKLDTAANVYVSGTFSSPTVDFDPSEAGDATLTNNGSFDAYICKFDTNGNYLWAKSIGGSSMDYANALNIDTLGNLIIVGTFGGSVNFDPGLSNNTLQTNVTNNSDIFVCKLDNLGNYIWSKSFASTTLVSKSVTALCIDNNNNAYITGTISGIVDFDPSTSTNNLTTTGNSDVFICKLNTSGDYVWAKSFGGTTTDTVTSIALDSNNNIYTTGSYTYTADFDPSSTTTNNFVSNGPNGTSDIYINKLDVNGNYVWTISFGGSGNDKGASLTIDSLNNIITTGSFTTTVDFNPGSATANLVYNGSSGTDIFISKLGTCVPVLTTDVQTSCGSYVWHGTTYTASNSTATWESINEGGCTDVATLNLTIIGTNTWNGTTNNLWSTPTNWSCGVVPDNTTDIEISSGTPTLDVDVTVISGKSLTISGTGALNIAPGKTLTIAGTADFGDKLVTFKSNESGSGNFGPLSGTLTGATNILVERYIPAKRAFRFLSPSVTTTTSIKENWQENGVTTAGLGTHITGTGGDTNGFDATATNNPSMFTFTNSGWSAVTSTNNVLTAGSPYRLMVRGDRNVDLTINNPTASATTLRATVTLTTGDYTPTLNQLADGFSLIGNPYQAPIDIKAILTASTNMNSGVVYYWDPILNDRGGYVTRSLSSNENDVTSSFNQYIQPGQAVFVKKDNTTNVPTMTITEANKSVANVAAGVFRTTNTSNSGVLRVNLQTNLNSQWQTIEGTLAIFNEAFSWNVNSEDATKMTNLDEEVSFIQNNTSLAITCQNNPSTTSELPIKIDKMRHANYQWKFDLTNYDGVTPFLYDSENNSYTQINNGTLVPFSVATSSTNRFKIVFQNNALNVNDFTTQISIYPNPTKANECFYIQGINEATIEVYNLLGQNIPVQTKNNGNTLQVSPKISINKGVYLVNIIHDGKTKQLKWIVD